MDTRARVRPYVPARAYVRLAKRHKKWEIVIKMGICLYILNYLKNQK
jgi:hypothetical protein